MVRVRVLFCYSGTREKISKGTGIRPTAIVDDETIRLIIMMFDVITSSFPGVRVFERLLAWRIQTKAFFVLLCPSRQIPA